MTSSQTNTFQSLLGRFRAFSALDAEDLTWLAQRAKPYHCSIGQELLSAERMPEICYCIIDGRGRVLHNDPGLQRPVTLAYAQPGDLIGWAGLARRSPCEWITAVTPMKLIGFSAEDFYQLEQRSQAFADWLDANNSPAELMAALAPALRRRPQADPPERDVLRRLTKGLKLIASRDQRQLPLDDGGIWLWNAQPEDQAVPVGCVVKPELLSRIQPGSPLRLLRVEADLWERELSPKLEAPKQSSLQGHSDPWSGEDRYADLLAPQPQGERRDDAAVGALIDRQDAQNLSWKGRRIPVVTGSGPLEQAMACLEMLAKYHNVPFRKDVVQRAAQQTLRGHACSLEQLGNLASWMGFLGTIVDVSEAQLHRLPFPCFALLLDQPAMIHDISKDEVKAVVPEYGCITVPISELLQGEAGVRVRTLAPGRDSQRRKLSFAWFLVSA